MSQEERDTSFVHSIEPRQPSKALLWAAQRKKYPVFSFPCHCSSAQKQNMHAERKGVLSLTGKGRDSAVAM